MGVLGDTCVISVNKEGVRFSVKGDLGTGNITRKQSTASENADEHTTVVVEEATELTFALRYLNFFTKVSICLTLSPPRCPAKITIFQRTKFFFLLFRDLMFFLPVLWLFLYRLLLFRVPYNSI